MICSYTSVKATPPLPVSVPASLAELASEPALVGSSGPVVAEVDAVDAVDAALAAGELTFSLDGVKLKGSWVLVKTNGRQGGERGWLLIKHRDEWASPDLDIEVAAPLSVTSGGDFADILAWNDPAIWQSDRPARGGATGAIFAEIVTKAAAIKAARRPKRSKRTPQTTH